MAGQPADGWMDGWRRGGKLLPFFPFDASWVGSDGWRRFVDGVGRGGCHVGPTGVSPSPVFVKSDYDVAWSG